MYCFRGKVYCLFCLDILFGDLMFVSSHGHLIVEGFGVSLRKKRGRILIVSSEGKREVAIKNIREVIISGKVSITSELLRTLAYNGVDLLLTSYTGTPLARLIPARMGGSAVNRVEQYKALEDGRGCWIIKYLLLGKIRNQASNLRYYSKIRKDLEEKKRLYDMASMVKDFAEKLEKKDPGRELGVCREELINIEAQAANIYWSGMKTVYSIYGFEERLKRPQLRKRSEVDPVNLMLNIGYNLLAGSLWKYVLRFSLDPFLGYLHVERPGRISLVYDLIEPFRPIMDRFVASYLRGKKLKPWNEKTRMDLIIGFREKYYEEFLGIRFRYRGRKHKLETIMFLYIEDIVSYLRGRKGYIPTPYIPW